MRYPPEHKQETRDRIVRAAARRFRVRGSRGAGIADLMRDLRLTHGGFYRHFRNKEELFVEAFEHALESPSGRIRSAVEQAPPAGKLKALIDAYLDIEHCEDVAGGCPVAALGSELVRHSPATRVAFERVMGARVKRVAAFLPGATVEDRERRARVLISGLAGTLTHARVLTDDAERRRLLNDAKRFYLDVFGR